MDIKNGIEELIGGTPLVRLSRYCEAAGIPPFLAKLECFNPTGSVKDRTAAFMLRDARSRGLLKSGVIVEPTSGNTGIGLAALGAAYGYRVIITMPDTASVERRKILERYGAELVLTDGRGGMSAAIAEAERIASELGAFMPDQFNNPSNPNAHYASTGPELFEATDGGIDILVAGVGSGGTLTGAAAYLKSVKSDVKAVAVEPARSAVLSGKSAGQHGIQGIGAGFIPSVLDKSIIDEVITVDDGAALEAMREIARTEGLYVGISSGAAAVAARLLAARSENANKNIVAVFPDSGDRY